MMNTRIKCYEFVLGKNGEVVWFACLSLKKSPHSSIKRGRLKGPVIVEEK